MWAVEAVAARGGARVVGQLRRRVVAAVGRLGPGWVSPPQLGRASRWWPGTGIDALDGYFAKYLPQLIATAVATPLLVLTIGWQDLTSGIILIVTLPLIPVFMVLVGWATQAAQKRQWAALCGAVARVPRRRRGTLDPQALRAAAPAGGAHPAGERGVPRCTR